MKRTVSLMVVFAILALLVASVASAGGRFGGGGSSFHSSGSSFHSSPSRSYSSPSRSSSSGSSGGWFHSSSPAPAPAPAFHAPAPAPMAPMAAPAPRPMPSRYGNTPAPVPATNSYKAPMRSAADTQMNRKANMTDTNSRTMNDLRRPAPTAASMGQPNYRVRGTIPTDSRYRFDTMPQQRPVYIPTVVVIGGVNRPLSWDPYYHTYGYYGGGAFYPYAGANSYAHHSNTGLIIFLVLLALAVVVGLAIASSRRAG